VVDYLETIKELNLNIRACMEQIEQRKPEDESVLDLALKLQEFVAGRQSFLNALIADPLFVDRELLAQQFDMTQTLLKQSNRILSFQQSLIQIGNKTKRQINVYKAIDSSR
jgi:hypothetical protein